MRASHLLEPKIGPLIEGRESPVTSQRMRMMNDAPDTPVTLREHARQSTVSRESDRKKGEVRHRSINTVISPLDTGGDGWSD